jgi:hypothetical protein
MAITKNTDRQEKIVAWVDVTVDDLTDGSAVEAIDLPAGAIILGGAYMLTTAFASQSADAVTVSCNGVTYVNDANAADALAYIAFTMPTTTATGDNMLTTPDTLDITWTATGTDSTVGAITLVVEYIVKGRSAFSQD